MIFDDLLIKQENLKNLITFLDKQEDIYLVGGAVRDFLLGIESHDLDFVMKGDVFKTARGAARVLKGKFFILDETRSTARVIVPGNHRFYLDFALMRGNNLLEDLKARDFTINAIAVDMKHPEKLLDPLKGAQDLKNRVLHTCSDTTYVDDPVRILRAIRFAFQFNLKFEKGSLNRLKTSIPGLSSISAERKRDELFKILEEKSSHSSIRALEILGILKAVMPELQTLKETASPNSYFRNNLEYALSTLRCLESLTIAASPTRNPEDKENLIIAMVNSELWDYRENIFQYFNQSLAGERKQITLLKIAALYSIITLDINEKSFEKNPFLIFCSDPKKMNTYLLKKFALSQDESRMLTSILINQYTLEKFSDLILAEDRRAIYKYFKVMGWVGVDLAFIKLAQGLAKSGNETSSETWQHGLSILKILCHAWFDKYEEWICPPRILSGYDLQQFQGFAPGPLLGKVLSALEESQAAGEVNTRKEAIRFVNHWHENHTGEPT